MGTRPIFLKLETTVLKGKFKAKVNQLSRSFAGIKEVKEKVKEVKKNVTHHPVASLNARHFLMADATDTF